MVIGMNTRDKMDIVLKNRMNGKSREECAKIAGISLKRITHWYTEGKQKIGKDNIYFYKALTKIEEKLGFKEKYGKDIELYGTRKNISKRKEFLNYIKNGETRKDSSRKARLDLKLISKWILLGKKGINPFTNFYNDYYSARAEAKRRERNEKERIKRETVKLIKKGFTLEKASKKVDGGKHEKTIINWYNSGRLGNKNHETFYNQCVNAQNPSVDNNIYAPLPLKWKEYFNDLPMNKTGIAWVNRIGNNWVYQRQIDKKQIRISNPDIHKLHKEVLKQNYVWGIRDQILARQVIDGSDIVKPSNEKVKVKYIRLNKKEFKAYAKGQIKNNELVKVMNKLKFFELDIENMQINRVKEKIIISIELKLNVSLLNSFENSVLDLGWGLSK